MVAPKSCSFGEWLSRCLLGRKLCHFKKNIGPVHFRKTSQGSAQLHVFPYFCHFCAFFCVICVPCRMPQRWWCKGSLEEMRQQDGLQIREEGGTFSGTFSGD